MLMGPRRVSQRCHGMPRHRGRADKRVVLKAPVDLTGIRELGLAIRAVTQNASALGMRVVVRLGLKAGDLLMASISTPVGKLRARVRIVYCQALPKRRFACGLQFEEAAIDVFSLLRGTRLNG